MLEHRAETQHHRLQRPLGQVHRDLAVLGEQKVEPPQEAAAWYRARCLNCHEPPDCERGADCVSCHMPKRRTQDVVNVIMTDHRIVRWPPPGDLLAPLAEQPPPLVAHMSLYFTDRPPPADEAMYRLLAAALDGSLDALDGLQRRLAAAPPGEPSDSRSTPAPK